MANASPTPRVYPSVMERIEAKTVIADAGYSTPCHEFMGQRKQGKHPYGKITLAGKHLRVHRVVWEHFNGPIPEDMLVLHRCDNPPCRNIEHLMLGTPEDNMKQMAERGRARNGRET